MTTIALKGLAKSETSQKKSKKPSPPPWYYLRT